MPHVRFCYFLLLSSFWSSLSFLLAMVMVVIKAQALSMVTLAALEAAAAD